MSKGNNTDEKNLDNVEHENQNKLISKKSNATNYFIQKVDEMWKYVLIFFTLLTGIIILCMYIMEFIKLRYFNISEKYITIDSNIVITQLTISIITLSTLIFIFVLAYSINKLYIHSYKKYYKEELEHKYLKHVVELLFHSIVIIIYARYQNIGKISEMIELFFVINLSILYYSIFTSEIKVKNSKLYTAIVKIIFSMYINLMIIEFFELEYAESINMYSWQICIYIGVFEILGKAIRFDENFEPLKIFKLFGYSVLNGIMFILFLYTNNKIYCVILMYSWFLFGLIILYNIANFKELKKILQLFCINILKLTAILVFAFAFLFLFYNTVNVFNGVGKIDSIEVLFLSIDGLGYYYKENDAIFNFLYKYSFIFLVLIIILVALLVIKFQLILRDANRNHIETRLYKNKNIINLSIITICFLMIFFRIVYCKALVQNNMYFDTITVAEAKQKIEIQDEDYYYYNEDDETTSIQTKDVFSGFVILHRYGNDFFIAPYYTTDDNEWDITIDVNKTVTIYSYGVDFKNTIFNNVQLKELKVYRQQE